MITDGVVARFRQIRYDTDIEAMLENEQYSQPNPWTAKRFNRHREHGGYCLLATHPVDGRKVIGHVLYSRVGSITGILKFVVRPGYRKQGVGSSMLRQIVRKGGLITTTVWERDLPMQQFLRGRGFLCTDVLYDMYRVTAPGDWAYVFTFGE